jgi:hypothetical protein
MTSTRNTTTTITVVSVFLLTTHYLTCRPSGQPPQKLGPPEGYPGPEGSTSICMGSVALAISALTTMFITSLARLVTPRSPVPIRAGGTGDGRSHRRGSWAVYTDTGRCGDHGAAVGRGIRASFAGAGQSERTAVWRMGEPRRSFIEEDCTAAAVGSLPLLSSHPTQAAGPDAGDVRARRSGPYRSDAG